MRLPAGDSPCCARTFLNQLVYKHRLKVTKTLNIYPSPSFKMRLQLYSKLERDKRYSDLSELVIKTVVEIQGADGTSLEGKQFTNATEAESLIKVGVINNLAQSL